MRDATLPSPEGSASEGAADRARVRRLAWGFSGLLVLVYPLLVLGALVRAHGAGLACPDWPLCFGEVIPQLDFEVAFEWGHRVLAGGVSVGFAGLALFALRNATARRATSRLIYTAALLLALQVLLGALTVWHLLAAWTVTAHLVTGNAFAVTLLFTALRLFEVSREEAPRRLPLPAGLAGLLAATAPILLLQIVLGGLVSSRYAGLACPDWPTCMNGLWFPTWAGAQGLHLFHRFCAYLLVVLLGLCAFAARTAPRLRALCAAAFTLGLLQALVGIANVLLQIPVEVTALHSGLAAALISVFASALLEASRAPRREARDAGPEPEELQEMRYTSRP